MDKESPLKGKIVLVVDDEPDILESVGEILDVATVHKATNYDTALQYLLGYTYDFVILDIMGVNGFQLLKESVNRGFPTIMFTANALTPEALKQSIKLGAVSFVPKDQVVELRKHLEESLKGENQVWRRIYGKLVSYFNNRLGPGWRERDVFLKDFEDELERNKGSNPNKKI